jgi:hypothetical protein
MNEPTLYDLAAAALHEWDDFRDDAPIRWEQRMTEAMEALRSHLRPVLVDADGPPAPRVCP